jgi:hypothetical protein
MAFPSVEVAPAATAPIMAAVSTILNVLVASSASPVWFVPQALAAAA